VLTEQIVHMEGDVSVGLAVNCSISLAADALSSGTETINECEKSKVSRLEATL
jgi:hypothetical protein